VAPDRHVREAEAVDERERIRPFAGVEGAVVVGVEVDPALGDRRAAGVALAVAVDVGVEVPEMLPLAFDPIGRGAGREPLETVTRGGAVVAVQPASSSWRIRYVPGLRSNRNQPRSRESVEGSLASRTPSRSASAKSRRPTMYGSLASRTPSPS